MSQTEGRSRFRVFCVDFLFPFLFLFSDGEREREGLRVYRIVTQAEEAVKSAIGLNQIDWSATQMAGHPAAQKEQPPAHDPSTPRSDSCLRRLRCAPDRWNRGTRKRPRRLRGVSTTSVRPSARCDGFATPHWASSKQRRVQTASSLRAQGSV